MSCDHVICKNSVVVHGLMADFHCAKCLVAGSIELSAAEACWENDPEPETSRDDDDDEPRRYESVPSFVEDEMPRRRDRERKDAPIPFLVTPKGKRAVRD